MLTISAQPQTVALFVSDLHLSPSCPKTTQAFFEFLRTRAAQAQRLYLLGDIFEAWAGDDDLSAPFNQSVVQAIRAAVESGVQVFWISGNRDVLVGQAFAQATGCTLLPDLCVVDLANKRIVIAHGDAQCTHDHAYMAFRAKTHHPIWQKLFLTLPLSLRQWIIGKLRKNSARTKQTKSQMMMDVNQAAIDAIFDSTGASVMIHGHTHQPQRHDSADGKRSRYVLPDWDCETKPERGGWVTLYADGSLRRFDIQGRIVTTYPQQHFPAGTR
ncbi:MAG: UDP-2,3-diacylglucosamine diphosphatase [Oxalobacter sp.]|nr:MAG: UDP-2,3-diacylglucosamine diphosphatase [Oxalobacter sp.]